jgi:hypothetical protein
MLPSQLTPDSFKSYPPNGRALLVANLPLLQKLPLGFAPFLLAEAIGYDWKFPVEQADLTNQLIYLSQLWEEQRKREMDPFAKLKLTEKLENTDWVNQPAQFLEQLSAHLWATQQMDGFREASETFIHKFNGSVTPEHLPTYRFGIAVLGQGVNASEYELFRKLRQSGVYFNHVNPAKGLETLTESLKVRAAAHNKPYSHWCIDGATMGAPLPGFTCLSYDSLSPVRTKLAAMMLTAYESTKFDPEKLRSTLASATPQSLGIADSGDPALDRFQVTLFTEGSGTQIYSTTFVQWAARETLRRAQPLTLFTRYNPRQKERTMDELLTGNQQNAATDPEGSLIDGDMGAYYTWINLQRLSGANSARFLAWFEGHNEAVAISPNLKPGTTDEAPIDMAGLLAKLG